MRGHKGVFHVPHPKATPIVNHNNFTDARPTLGSASTSYNPGKAQAAGVFPKGPPRSIQVGPKRSIAKGLTNKRYQYD